MLLFIELQIFGHNLATEQQDQLKKIIRVFQVALVVKNLLATAGDERDVGPIPGQEDTLEEENGNPLEYFCLKNYMDKRSQEDYSPQVCKELDMIEELSIHVQR